ncbi:MAG: ABC transporter permease [Bacillati bacterium ANGP1]|uniref:ABC transporter permease n=1 Tax=Candidatus Segetimicrobium genomatis TaxID=2569760 RepID=A0A537JSV0_9BACT|nr:MAG: ABC transporter permease [Terrabacteria group bacterium ANGP1]
MATSIRASSTAEAARDRSFRHPLEILERFGRNKIAAAGLVTLLVMLAASALAGVILPYDPDAANLDLTLHPPTPAHLLGTDQLGRDILTRVVYGGRISLVIGVLAVALSAAIGIPLGVLSGFYGGVADAVIQRVIDVVLAFPGFLLALTLISILGVGLANVVISVGIASVPIYVRLVRAVTLTVREMTYVESARATGQQDRLIMLRHVLPNAAGPIVVQSSLQLGAAILTAAGLGFLGLGVRPPTPEWGTMLGEAQTYLLTSWFIATFPGLAIFLAVMAFNLLGDGLRDALDPRMKVL